MKILHVLGSPFPQVQFLNTRIGVYVESLARCWCRTVSMLHTLVSKLHTLVSKLHTLVSKLHTLGSVYTEYIHSRHFEQLQ